jgi:hypothetical protein
MLGSCDQDKARRSQDRVEVPAAGSLLPLSLLFAKTFRCAEGAGGQDLGLASSQFSARDVGLAKP